MISGFDKDSIEDSQTIKVQYKDGSVTKYINTNIYLIRRTGIQISEKPKKLEYIEDEVDKLDITGTQLVEKLHNGKTGEDTTEAIDSSEYSLSDFSGFDPTPSEYGSQEITVSLYGFKDTFNVNVKKKSLKNIEIISMPDKLEYVEGQSFDVTGLSVYGIYDNGKKEIIPLDRLLVRMNVKDGDTVGDDGPGEKVRTDVVGTHQVTVLCQDENDELSYFACDFEINVIAKVVTAIEMTKSPSKLEFPQSDVTFADYNFSDGELIATYNDGDTKTVSLSDAEIFEFDIDELGAQTVAVSYGGKRTTFEATVREPQVLKTTFTPPTKAIYAEGEVLSLDGAAINIGYDNGLEEHMPIDIDDEDIDVSFKSGENIGGKLSGDDKILVVKYKDKTLDVVEGGDATISIKKRIGIEIANYPDNVSYPQGADVNMLDFTGLQVNAIFEDESSTPVPESEYEIDTSGFDSSELGETTIKVKAYDFEASFDVSIREKRLTSIELLQSPDKLDYVEGQTFDISGIQVDATYDNGQTAAIEVKDSDLRTSDTSSADIFTTAKADTYEVYVVLADEGDEGEYSVASEPFTVNVHEKVAQSITLKEGPKNIEFPQNLVGFSQSSFGAGTITVDYGYGYTEDIDLSKTVISGLEISEVGPQTVTISYGGQIVTFEATVTEPSVDSTYVTAPAKTSYTKGEALDMTGASFVVKLNNGREESFSLTSDEDMTALQEKYGYTVAAQFVDENGNAADANTVGTKTLSVTCTTSDGTKESVAMSGGTSVTVQVSNPPAAKPGSGSTASTTKKTTTTAKKTTTTAAPAKTTPKYSNEWVNGKWYGADGRSTYSGKLSWKSNAKGWWVEDTAGWYPTSSWQKIDGVWYYFKPDGYMASEEYYNGYWFNKNGSWDSRYKLSWKQNSTGWWVEDVSGWWPSSSWLKIDGDWYYFDGSGYMVTSQYVGGWWIGADGVCR